MTETPAGVTLEHFIEFVDGYIECALWLTGDGEEHESFEGFELAESERNKVYEQCADFLNYAMADVQAYVTQRKPAPGYTAWNCAGHDFWLTRNGHGAGFWDRGLGALGDRLSDASKSFGSVDLYLGDDGLIYTS